MTWPPPPPAWPLAKGEVHVWFADLDLPAQRRAVLARLLSADERQRADRYSPVPAREQFVAARGLLRVLLGAYLHVPPAEVVFAAGPQGKPTLAGAPLHFNVSHSRGGALIAVTTVAEVGVDLERLRPYPNYRDMAERFFHPGEAAALVALPAAQAEQAFFHVWTRKEAFLKATGLGIAGGLERVQISVPPDEPARVLDIDGASAPAARWSLTTLLPREGYVGALALEARNYQLKCWTWE
jgi:4'-phosphopantetheinyl transferase